MRGWCGGGRLKREGIYIYMCVCVYIYVCVCVCTRARARSQSLQSSPVLYDPRDCILPGSSVHGILQARILEWIAMPFSRDLPDPGIEPASPVSPALQADSLLLNYWEAYIYIFIYILKIMTFILMYGSDHDPNT